MNAMQVSLETLSELERKLSISLPENDIQEEVNVRLKNLAPKVQIQGFRQGKVPMTMVRQRFSSKVREEVVRDLMQSALQNAIELKELKLAGYPKINVTSEVHQGDFNFEAVIEVFPEVQIEELQGCEVDIVQADVSDSDLTEMLNKLRAQYRNWSEVKRKSKNDDQMIIDFSGFIDGVAFEGGEAKDFTVVLGEKKMIPDFEKGLVGHEAGEEFDLDVTFPEDYGQQDLAGKQATFKIKVHAVKEGELPELDDEFANKLNVKAGVEGLKKDIQQNMQRELKKQVSQINRKAVFDKLIEKNALVLPTSLIDHEIKNLQHELYHRIFGQEHHDNEKIPDFPRELFVDEATRRVHLSLLYAEYVKKHQISVEQAKIDALLDEVVSAFEDAAEAKAWYLKDKNRMADLESLLMEEAVVEKILESAKSNLKKMNYHETMEYAQRKNSGDKA